MNDNECPVCGDVIQLPGKLYRGQLFTCSACESTLEILNIDPIELDFFYEEGDELMFPIDDPHIHNGQNLVRCPNCEKFIYIQKQIWIGDRITCESCGIEHQVIGLNPLEIDIPFDDSEFGPLDDDFEESSYDFYRKI